MVVQIQGPVRAGRRSWAWLVALGAALGPGAATAERCQIRQMEIPVRLVDRRPIATVQINGTAVSLLVDSGAFFSMLAPATATQLNLTLHKPPPQLEVRGYTGTVDTKLTRVDSLGLQGAQLPNVEFLVGGSETGWAAQGLLGRDVLSQADTEYDLAHGVVRLSFPKGDCQQTRLAHWAGDAPVIELPLDDNQPRSDSAIRVKVLINGRKSLALLDTGAPRTSMSLTAALRAGVDREQLKPNGQASGLGQRKVASWRGRIATLEVGGEKINNADMTIDDVPGLEQDLILGLDYFLSHRIYVSRLQGQLYATWNGTPVFATERDPAAQRDTRDAAVPADVDPDNADALARRGAAALAARDYERALADLNRACELAPGVATTFFDRARVHLAQQHHPQALADLDTALRLDPKLAEARFRRALLRELLDDDAAAQADLQQLDATLPPSSHLRSGMATLHAAAGRAPEALRQFDLWVDSHPEDAGLADVLNGRCWLRTRLNFDVPLALNDCQRAVQLDPASADARDSLGWTYLRLGDAARARKAFDQALRIRPQATALYGRGLAWRRLNDPAAADQDLEAARRLRPAIDDEARRLGFEFVDAAPAPATAGT